MEFLIAFGGTILAILSVLLMKKYIFESHRGNSYHAEAWVASCVIGPITGFLVVMAISGIVVACQQFPSGAIGVLSGLGLLGTGLSIRKYGHKLLPSCNHKQITTTKIKYDYDELDAYIAESWKD
jgi:hypothetical protein